MQAVATYARILCAMGILLALGACGSASRQPDAPRDSAWVQSQLAALPALPCPEGCSTAEWQALKDTLADALRGKLSGKQTAAPPTLAGSKPVAQLDPADNSMTWYFASTGDYNQDGLVSINDLTPLGARLGTSVTAGLLGYGSPESVVDGDGNGLITIADITPLGANFGIHVAEWRVYSSDSLADYPAPGEASTIAPLDTRAVDDSFQGPPFRRSYSPQTLPVDPARYYWVRSVDGDVEGIPSNAVGGNNQPPLLVLAVTTLEGAPPFKVGFDASVSSDPEGGPLDFIWYFEDSFFFNGQPGASELEHEFTIEGVFRVRLRVIDEQGAWAEEQLIVTSSNGAKWHPSFAASEFVLQGGDIARLAELEDASPAVAFTAFGGGASTAYYARPAGGGWSLWNQAGVLGTVEGEIQDLDLEVIDRRPAAWWNTKAYADAIERGYFAHADNESGGAGEWPVKQVLQGGNGYGRITEVGTTGEAVVGVWTGGAPDTVTSLQGLVSDVAPWTPHYIDLTDTGNYGPAIASIGGMPAVMYYNIATSQLRYCDSFYDTGTKIDWNPPVMAQICTMEEVLHSSLIELADGSPACSYLDTLQQAVLYTRAPNSFGDSFIPPNGIDQAPAGSMQPSMALVRGLPVVVYYHGGQQTLLAEFCEDSDGLAWNSISITDNVMPDVLPEIAEIAGKPAVVYAQLDGQLIFSAYY